MEIKLVVANGKNAGQVIAITGPKFLIGRADDCQLRPKSDVISRYHCVLLVEETFIAVRDFGSKNGTFVNDEQIMGEQDLKNGDRLRVGQLEFDVQMISEVEQSTRATAEGGDVASQTTVDSNGVGQLDLSDWLGQADASGTVLGMLPLRKATSLDEDAPTGTSDALNDEDSGSNSPKK